MADKIVDQQANVTPHTGDTLSLPTIEIVARSLHEYRTMLRLDADGCLEQLLKTPGATILDCPGSASSFGSEVRNMAGHAGSDLTVVSADIVYDHTPRQIYNKAVETVHRLLDPLIADGNSWRNSRWLSKKPLFATPRDLLEHRLAVYNAYLGDAEKNKNFYVATALPDLTSLRGYKFDLIVSGNLLFAYADKHFGNNSEERLEFHVKSILNFCKLLKDGGELRIYPIGTASAKVYPQMKRLVSTLKEAGYELLIRKIEVMQNPDWDQMAVITRRPSVTNRV